MPIPETKPSGDLDVLAIVARLQARIAEQDRYIEGLEARIAEIEKSNAELASELAKARKNSSTSSKPPSSDIVKPPKKPGAKGGKRKRGGQPGHPKHERRPFAPEEVDETHQYTLEACPDCGGSVVLRDDQAPRVIQQVEIVEKPFRIHEHRGLACWCEHCRAVHYAPLPSEVETGGLAGPRLTAHVAYMKGACHASYSTVQKYLRDVWGLAISRGQLAKIVGKVSEALEAPYAELLDRLPLEARLNVDETGHKDNGDRFWTWCFRAELYALFRIAGSRGSKVLIEVLGKEFDGVLGCDYFSAYRKYMKDFDVPVQFCLAHLIRDVKFLATLPDAATKAYGRRLLEGLRALFGLIHRREEMDGYAFAEALELERGRILDAATADVPASREARNMARRFRKHGEAYFRFITTPGVEPTNNLAEQAIRFVVIDRAITQGTRGERGRRWCERIWTVLATCARQGRSAFEFIREAVEAHFSGQPAPSLLLNPS